MRDGQVVNGLRFRDHVVVGGIEELALRYRDEGADELVFYDITASPERRSVDRAWIKRIARLIDIPFWSPAAFARSRRRAACSAPGKSMLGYMSRESLAATRVSGQVTFFSRSKQRLWIKGESSGHFLQLVSVETDCDSDSLLIQARPQGPTCHLQRASCFTAAPANFLADLDQLIATRERERPEASYTTRLFESGLRRIAQKVGEEGVETSLAGVVEDDAALLGESADLIYHLLVLLRARGLPLANAVGVLEQRHC